MKGSLGVAVLLGLVAAEEHSAGRLREALLKEAEERLTTWYADKSSLELPFYRDGAQVQISKGECLCDTPGGDGQVPLTFGQFDVDGADPVDIFNVLTDWRKQTSWDPTVTQSKEVPGNWTMEDGVQALQLIYPTGIILTPDREILEWVAYRADFQEQEFWVVYSTLNNERIREVSQPIPGTVQMQNCLGGYWIRPKPDGTGSHVLFTQHVNLHPPNLVSAKFVFDVSWGKEIDYVNLLRHRSQQQSQLAWPRNRTVVDPSLLSGSHEAAALPCHCGQSKASLVGLWAPLGLPRQPPRSFAAAAACALLAATACVALRLRRRGEASNEEEATLLEAARC